MKSPRGHRPGETYTKDQINLILKHISKRSPSGIRNRAAIAMMFGSGCRIEELTNLMPSDVDLATGRVTIKKGKGSKYRVVGLPEQLGSMVQLWINERKRLGYNGTHRLFCSLRGGPTSTEYYRGFCKRLSKRIEEKEGVNIRVHPHGLRHSMAMSLVRDGFNILQISQQLGHSNLSTTQRYLQKIAPEELVNSMYTRKNVL